MSASRRDLRATLQRAGTRPVPKPSAAFVAGLEARLLSSAELAPGPMAVVPDARPTRAPRRRLVPVLGAVAAAVAALVLVGALSGWFAGSSTDTPTLVSARDTTVILPDGRAIEGRAGLELPDGALVRTGPDGAATAGGVEIGPGAQARVSDGQVQTTSPTLPSVTIPTVPTIPTAPPVSLPPTPSLP